MNNVFVNVEKPKSNYWTDYLEFTLRMLPQGDPAFSFVASLYTYAEHHGGLTDKQIKRAKKYSDAAEKKWQELREEQFPHSTTSPKVDDKEPSYREKLWL